MITYYCVLVSHCTSFFYTHIAMTSTWDFDTIIAVLDPVPPYTYEQTPPPYEQPPLYEDIVGQVGTTSLVEEHENVATAGMVDASLVRLLSSFLFFFSCCIRVKATPSCPRKQSSKRTRKFSHAFARLTRERKSGLSAESASEK